MNRLRRVVQLLGVNAVPVGGVFFDGWSTSTALVLYWCENLALVLLVAARIAVHRRLTGKRGHVLAQVEFQSTGKGGGGKTAPGALGYGASFLTTGLAFTLAHGLFLAMLVFLVFPERFREAGTVDFAALARGFGVLLVFLGLGLVFDLIGMRQRSFAWLKRLADQVLGRIVLIHLTIIFGLWAMVAFDLPLGMFVVFAALKFLTDLGTMMPQRPLSDKAPGCLAPFAGAAKKQGQSLDKVWKTALAQQKALAEEYERPMEKR